MVGPLITALAILVLEVVHNTPFGIPNPPAVLVLTVVFSAFVGGLGSGLVSATLAWLYVAVFFSTPNQLLQFTTENVRRVSVWAVSLSAAAVMVGLLKTRAERALEELRANAIQQEHQEAEIALHASEARFRALIEHSTDVVAMLNADGTLLYQSPAIKRMLGHEPQEILGRNAFEFIHPDDQARAADLFAQLLTHPGTVVTGQVRYKHSDASWRWVEVTATNLLSDPAVQAIVVNYYDTTERVLAEARLRSREERFRALIENSSDIITTLDAQGLIRFQSPAVERVLGYKPEDLIGQSVFNYLHADEAAAVAEAILQAIKQPGLVITIEFRFRHHDGSWRILESVGKRTVDEDGRLGSVINSRDITDRKQRELELEAIATVSTALRTAPTRTAMLPIILDHLLDLLHADGAALAWHDPASGGTIIEMGRGQWANAIGLRLAPGEGVSGHVIATGQPYLNNDALSDPRFTHFDLLGEMRAVACVPLMVRDRAIGALWAGRQTRLNGTEFRILHAIGDIAASALHRATLHEQTERQVQKLAALRTIDMVINSSVDLRLTLSVLLEQVVTQLRVDAADVLLFNPLSQTLDFVNGRGFYSKAPKNFRMRLGEGYAGQAALERKTTSILDLRSRTTNFLRAPLAIAEDFITYHAVPLIAKGQVKGVLEVFHRASFNPDNEWLDFLEILGGQLAIALDSAEMFDGLQRTNVELALAYDATIEGWSHALDLRDKETEGHSQRVTEMTLRLARAMNLSEEALVHVRRGALLHDIGKMGVPDKILLKPGPLTNEEWIVMRRHPLYAYEMLSPIGFLRPALDIPFSHHEKWDGTGYPRGLTGDAIPLAARIFAVADVWDALRSDRPYRPAWPEEKVLQLLREQAGKHFDIQIIEIFLNILNSDSKSGSGLGFSLNLSGR